METFDRVNGPLEVILYGKDNLSKRKMLTVIHDYINHTHRFH